MKIHSNSKDIAFCNASVLFPCSNLSKGVERFCYEGHDVVRRTQPPLNGKFHRKDCDPCPDFKTKKRVHSTGKDMKQVILLKQER